jgi:16S rRNA (guanine966-N2)-methyltransferase
MKIIAGKYKNRVIPTFKKAEYRPSTSKFREALFSIITSGEIKELQPLEHAHILDVFAGTGALSFEALSRGAQSTTLIDVNSEYLEEAKKFAEKIGESENVLTICSDALRVNTPPKQYDIIFLDPPYYRDLNYKTIQHLIKNNWFSKGALVVVEQSNKESLKPHKNLELIKEKTYGKNKLLIYRFI